MQTVVSAMVKESDQKTETAKRMERQAHLDVSVYPALASLREVEKEMIAAQAELLLQVRELSLKRKEWVKQASPARMAMGCAMETRRHSVCSRGGQKDSMDVQMHGQTETDGAQKGYAFQAIGWATMIAFWSERMLRVILLMVTLVDGMERRGVN